MTELNVRVRCWYQDANVGQVWPPKNPVTGLVDWDYQLIGQADFFYDGRRGKMETDMDYRVPWNIPPDDPGYFVLPTTSMPAPVAGKHWCVGCYIFADGVNRNPIQDRYIPSNDQAKPWDISVLAQVNYWVLAERAAKGTTQFVEDVDIGNPFHEAASFIIRAEQLPEGYFILPDSTLYLSLDSLADTTVTFTITAHNVNHGDTAVVEFNLYRENPPCGEEYIGGLGHTLVTDNVPPQPVTDIDVVELSPFIYEISWQPVYTDSLGYIERISHFEIHAAYDPDSLLYPDSNTLYAVTARDQNDDVAGIQHVTDSIYTPLYFTVVTVDAAENVGAPAAAVSGCCDIGGDANNDGLTNVADAVFIVNYVFKGGAAPYCPQEGDANSDGVVNIGDAVFLINYVFKNGPAPTCP